MRLQVNMIIDAVRSTVPQSMCGDIVDKLDQPQQHHAIDAETEAFDDDWDGNGRAHCGEIDDDLWVDKGDEAYYDEVDEEVDDA